MFEKALEDIRILYSGGVCRSGWGGCIGKEEVLLWASESNLSIQKTFDQVSLGLARAYIDRTLDWDFCDAAANDLFGTLMDFYVGEENQVDEPKLFWKFFLAFDYSETVEEDKADEVARTEIRELLSDLPSKR